MIFKQFESIEDCVKFRAAQIIDPEFLNFSQN